MKIKKYLLISLTMNIVLYILILLLPINPMQYLISYIISFFVFLLIQAKLSILHSNSGYILSTANGNLRLYQTFYEFLTIMSLTIPLYLNNLKLLIKKLSLTLLAMIFYYVIIYTTLIIRLEQGHSSNLLLKFIQYNTEVFMIFAFLLLFYIINKKSINSLIKEKARLL